MRCSLPRSQSLQKCHLTRNRECQQRLLSGPTCQVYLQIHILIIVIQITYANMKHRVQLCKFVFETLALTFQYYNITMFSETHTKYFCKYPQPSSSRQHGRESPCWHLIRLNVHSAVIINSYLWQPKTYSRVIQSMRHNHVARTVRRFSSSESSFHRFGWPHDRWTLFHCRLCCYLELSAGQCHFVAISLARQKVYRKSYLCKKTLYYPDQNGDPLLLLPTWWYRIFSHAYFLCDERIWHDYPGRTTRYGIDNSFTVSSNAYYYSSSNV